MKNEKLMPIMIALALTLSGCISQKNVSDDGEAEEVGNIFWLQTALQDEGVFVSANGAVNWNIPALESTQLILDGRESLSVYHFEDARIASGEAYELAGRYPLQDVYLKDELVIVRRSTRDTGLSQTLRGILGNAL